MALQATDGDENPSGVRPSGLPPGFCPARRAEARRQPRRAGPTFTNSKRELGIRSFTVATLNSYVSRSNDLTIRRIC